MSIHFVVSVPPRKCVGGGRVTVWRYGGDPAPMVLRVGLRKSRTRSSCRYTTYPASWFHNPLLRIGSRGGIRSLTSVFVLLCNSCSSGWKDKYRLRCVNSSILTLLDTPLPTPTRRVNLLLRHYTWYRGCGTEAVFTRWSHHSSGRD